MYKIFLDDKLRPIDVYYKSNNPFYKNQFVICTSYKEFTDHITKQYTQNGIYPDFISFDFMLSDNNYILNSEDYSVYFSDNMYNEGNGVDCAKFIIDFCKDNSLKIPEYIIHDTNMTGRRMITKLFTLAKESTKEDIEMTRINDNVLFNKVQNESESTIDNQIEMPEKIAKKRGRKKGWRKHSTNDISLDSQTFTESITEMSEKTVKKRGRKKGWRKASSIPVENIVNVLNLTETTETTETTVTTKHIDVKSIIDNTTNSLVSLLEYIKILENENNDLKNELKKLKTF